MRGLIAEITVFQRYLIAYPSISSLKKVKPFYRLKKINTTKTKTKTKYIHIPGFSPLMSDKHLSSPGLTWPSLKCLACLYFYPDCKNENKNMLMFMLENSFSRFVFT